MVFTSTNDGLNWKKEAHECDFGGTGGHPDCADPDNHDYNDIPGSTTHLHRNKEFGALYGVGILDEDNSAAAGGYQGLYALRDPATGVWRDRSHYNQRIDDVPMAVTLPMFGVATNGGDITTGKVIVTGSGGNIREKVAPDNWADVNGVRHGSPWRFHDVQFTADNIGFQIGQYSRIARTGDFGTNWSHQGHPPQFEPGGVNGPNLTSITFADVSRGVAVGLLNGGLPAIWYTLNGHINPPTWVAPDPSSGFILGGVAAGLRDVTFAGITSTLKADYWAAGDSGFILHSKNDGMVWRQYLPLGVQNLDFTIHGVAFKDLSIGIFVGRGPEPIDTPLRAVAYQYKQVGSSITWTNISPNLPNKYSMLSDVVISGTTAFAVGDWLNTLSGIRTGAVLRSDWDGTTSTFSAFTPVTDGTIPAFPECTSNDPFNDIEETPVLLETEVAPTSLDLWVGGQCGRVWKRTTAGVWTEFQSQTDTHILGISCPSSAVGYFGGHRGEYPQQCLVRHQ